MLCLTLQHQHWHTAQRGLYVSFEVCCFCYYIFGRTAIVGGYDCTKSFSLIRVVEVNASAKIHQSDALLFICQQSSGSLSGSSVHTGRSGLLQSNAPAVPESLVADGWFLFAVHC